MPSVSLLVAHPQATETEGIVALVSKAFGQPAFEERESSNYPQERYFRAYLGQLEVKVMVDDTQHDWKDDLPYRIHFYAREGSEGELLDRVDELVRQDLLPLGFRVAHVSEFGTYNEVRRDY